MPPKPDAEEKKFGNPFPPPVLMSLFFSLPQSCRR